MKFYLKFILVATAFSAQLSFAGKGSFFFDESFVGNLPEDIFTSVSNEWLNVEDFTKFQVAFNYSTDKKKYSLLPTVNEQVHALFNEANKRRHYACIPTRMNNPAIIEFVQNCSKLTSLSLVFCNQLQDDFIIELSQYCSNLTLLDLSNCSSLTDFSIKEIIKNSSKHLRSLTLSNCNIKDDLLVMISECCSNFILLDLSHCPLITDFGVKEIIKYSSRCLKHLILSNYRITDASLVMISQYCSNFTFLDLSHCLLITDFGVKKTIEHSSKYLRSLILKNCKIEDDSLVMISRHCPFLSYLDVSNSNVTNNSVFLVMDKCSNLTFLNLCYCDLTEDKPLSDVYFRNPRPYPKLELCLKDSLGFPVTEPYKSKKNLI